MFDYDSDSDAELEELEEHEPTAPETKTSGEHRALGPAQVCHVFTFVWSKCKGQQVFFKISKCFIFGQNARGNKFFFILAPSYRWAKKF